MKFTKKQIKEALKQWASEAWNDDKDNLEEEQRFKDAINRTEEDYIKGTINTFFNYLK